jgi:hypothetical protein
MNHPSVTVTLANRVLTAAEAGLAAITVTLARNAHDTAQLELWPRSKFASAAAGDDMAIKLGFKDEDADVWTGLVTRIDRAPDVLRITGHAPSHKLSRAYKSQTYVGQSVADLVRDLASEIDVDTVDVSADLAYYAVDHRRSMWGHLLDLALVSGAEVSASASGGLRFVAIDPLPSTTTFRYGAEILAWHAGPGTPAHAPVFAASGSASESGSDKWHWLNPDPTGGNGGSQVIGAFHAKALAESLSSALGNADKRSSVAGTVELTGQAAVRCGDVFSLSDLPSGDPGPLRALSVIHRIDARRGFRTTVRVEGTGT